VEGNWYAVEGVKVWLNGLREFGGVVGRPYKQTSFFIYIKYVLRHDCLR